MVNQPKNKQDKENIEPIEKDIQIIIAINPDNSRND